MILLSTGCENPVQETPVQSARTQPMEEDMSDEITAPVPREVNPVEQYPAYHVYGGHVKGLPSDFFVWSQNVSVGHFVYFDVVDGVIYFGVYDVRLNEDGDGTEGYTRHFVQTGTELAEVEEEYQTREIPRATFSSGGFRIEIETYNGDEISKIYNDNVGKSEPLRFIDGAYMAGTTLIFSVRDGRTGRNPGIYRWEANRNTPVWMGNPGTVLSVE